MSLSIEATFENGVFIPLVRPTLANHERVRLIVEPIDNKAPTAEEIVERGRRQRIQIDPDLARDRDIAGIPSGGVVARMPLNLPDGVILPLDAPLLIEAADISKQVGLLTNDALTVALMRRHAVTHLVTNDDDFIRVPAITVWQPR